MRSLQLIIITLLLPVTLLSGGFQINVQGQRQLGMAHTGTGLLLDGSCLFFNPGGSAFLSRKFSVSAGMNFLMPRTIYRELSPGIYSAEMVHNTGTPFQLYGVYHRAKLSFGLAVYTPFGSRAQWEDDWKGQFIIREINLKTIFIQPTVTYKLGDYIGIGAGFVYATGGFDLRKGVPVQNSSTEYGEGNLSGSASGIGFNSGLYVRVNDVLSFGVSYRSSVEVTVNGGSADFTVPSTLAEYFPSTTFSTALKLPSVINAGVGYQTGRWKLAADFNYVGWSSYDSLRIDFAENTDKLDDISSARMYRNSWIARAGAEYQTAGRLQFRFGAYYDRSPVQDGYLTPETPDADRLGFTGGIGVVLGNNLSMDLSLLFVEGMQRTDTNLETQFGGTYKSRLISPGFGFSYQF